MQYIQGNQPCMIHYFFFDIDRAEAVMAWYDANLPKPYWTAQTHKNGHAHICYKLEIPLCTSELASQKGSHFLKQLHKHFLRKKSLFNTILQSSILAVTIILILFDIQIILNFFMVNRSFPRRIIAASQTIAEALEKFPNSVCANFQARRVVIGWARPSSIS